MSDDVKAVMREDGRTDNYFGGEGRADGKGHGHVVAGSDGNTHYEREAAKYLPGSSRGERVSKDDRER